MRTSRGTKFTRLTCEALEDRVTPALAFALSGTNLISFDTATPATIIATTPIAGVTGGETLVGIDFRPATGVLYGLGVNATANTASLYTIDTTSAAATLAVAGTAGLIAFTTEGTTPVDLPDPTTVGYGFDFNPAADRIRVVAGTVNFRINQLTGLGVDGDNTGLTTGTISGTNPDGTITGATTVNGAAYTNSQAGATVTTLYTLDSASDRLFIQNPPNNGAQTTGLATGVNFGAVSGFDIPQGVNAPASNSPVTTGTAFAVLTVGATTSLYSINLVTGAATVVGPVGTGATAISGFALAPAGTFAFGSATATVAENAGPATITITRTGGTAGAVAITVTATNGTATAGTDFTGGPYTVNFADGATTATVPFTIPITDDGTTEGDETFTLTITAVSAGAIGAQNTTAVTIADNEGAGVIAFGSATATVAEGAGNATITLTRTNGTTGIVTVTVASADGTATAGTDYTAVAPTVVTFAAGQATATVTVPITNDAVGEPTETFTLAITLPTGGATVGAQSTTTVSITDDDAGTFAFGSATATVAENAGNAAITITRTGGSTGMATLTVTSTNGTATAGSDFIGGPYTVFFLDGQTTAMLMFPITNDAVGEPTETFTLTITAASIGLIGAQNTTVVSITDDDAGTIAFGSATATVAEDGGNAVITLTRTGGTTGAVAVTVVASNGTATAGTDFTGGPYTVNFVAGQTTATLLIPITNDVLIEGSETFTLTITAVSAGLIGAPAATTVTITDNDAAGVIAFQNATTTVAENVAGGNALITLTRTGGSTGAVSVTVVATPGTAATPGDYGTVPTTVTFADGATTATLTIPITNDAVAEGVETFLVTISAPTGGATLGAQTTNTVSITDDDGPGIIAFQSATTTVAENVAGGNAVITLTRTGGSGGAVSATVSVTAGTATAGTDFTSGPYTVNFAAGQTTATLLIPITNDTAIEGPETITLTLSAPTGGATLGTQTTTVLIITDDDAAGTVAFGSTTATVSENGGNALITLTRTGGSSGTVVVTVASASGTATAGSDFIGGPYTVTFANGATTATLVVPIANDANLEGQETLTVTITAVSGGATIGSPSTATLTIVDDDGGLNFLIGTGAGLPLVQGFNVDGSLRTSFTPYGPNATGGVRVAMGDITGDGVADIITVPGTGPAIVMAFDGVTGASLGSFLALVGNNGGASLAVGDLNGDGRADIILGATTGLAVIEAYSGANLSSLGNFTPFGLFFGGVNVAAGDLNGDGLADVVAGQARFGTLVAGFSGKDLSSLGSFFAFPGLTSGITLALADLNNDGLLDIIVGTASGPAFVGAFSGANLSSLGSFQVFNGAPVGVNVTAPDLNGDGRPDILVGSVFGIAQLSGFDGTNLAPFGTLLPFGALNGGIFVG